MDDAKQPQTAQERAAAAGRDRNPSRPEADRPGAGSASRATEARQDPGARALEAGQDATMRTAGAGQDAARRGAEAAQEALSRAAEAGQQAGMRGLEAGQGAFGSGGEAAERGAQGVAELMRQGAGLGRRGGEAAAETTRHGLRIAAGGQERLMREAAAEMERARQGIALTAQETADSVRSLVSLPAFSADGMRQAHVTMAQLVEGVVASNLRVTQEWMRRTGPSSVVELQRHFLRDYFNALAEGGWQLLRLARQAADESLHPLEDRMRQHRTAAGQDEAAGGPHRAGGGKDDAPVGEVMTREMRLASPEDSVQQVARMMGEQDTGAVPVGEGDRLVGMVTDRDLAVRLVAAGRDPARTKVREVMTTEPRYVFEDEPVHHVCDVMAEQQVQRLPVLNRQKRLVGMVSSGDIARRGGPQAGEAQHRGG